jgi:hypothetical protein
VSSELPSGTVAGLLLSEGCHIGGDEQMFGEKQQISRGRASD